MKHPRLIIKGSVALTEPSRGFTNNPGVGPGASTRYAPTNKLRQQARAGMGEMQAEQIAVQRMMRMTSETAEPPRHVVTIQDVTRGLGLNQIDEQRIQKAVSETNVEFTPKTQTQRLFLARGSLHTLLRSMDAVGGDARMEISKRATAWWRKQADVDLNRSRTVHFISFQKAELEKGGKVDRWITVRGARIPIGGDGKPFGALADKIFGEKKKKKSRTEKEREDFEKWRQRGGEKGTKTPGEKQREDWKRHTLGKSMTLTPPAERRMRLEWK